jgi:hypothetical protein
MDKAMELVDAWMKNQKDFMDSWVKSQKEATEKWAEATKKMQASLMSLGGAQQGPAKEVLGLYNSWLTTMVNSAKTFTDESGKIQATWKSTVEKQMEMTREMVSKLSELFKQTAEKKK